MSNEPVINESFPDGLTLKKLFERIDQALEHIQTSNENQALFSALAMLRLPCLHWPQDGQDRQCLRYTQEIQLHLTDDLDQSSDNIEQAISYIKDLITFSAKGDGPTIINEFGMEYHANLQEHYAVLHLKVIWLRLLDSEIAMLEEAAAIGETQGE